MDEAIKILRHAEAVLMKKIKGMKDGKPKYAATTKVRELRYAIDILKQVNLETEADELAEDEMLAQIFESKPPMAQA